MFLEVLQISRWCHSELLLHENHITIHKTSQRFLSSRKLCVFHHRYTFQFSFFRSRSKWDMSWHVSVLHTTFFHPCIRSSERIWSFKFNNVFTLICTLVSWFLTKIFRQCLSCYISVSKAMQENLLECSFSFYDEKSCVSSFSMKESRLYLLPAWFVTKACGKRSSIQIVSFFLSFCLFLIYISGFKKKLFSIHHIWSNDNRTSTLLFTLSLSAIFVHINTSNPDELSSFIDVSYFSD